MPDLWLALILESFEDLPKEHSVPSFFMNTASKLPSF